MTMPAATPAIDERFERLPIEQIVPSKTNPRTHFNEIYIAELAGSIADKGVVQPILVRPLDILEALGTGHAAATAKNGAHYEIVAGECRFRASQLAKQLKIPAVIRQLTDEQVLEIQLIENIHRRDLTALEQAAGYRKLIDTNPDKHSAASIAQRIGMSEAWVWDRLKLNDLIPEAKRILERELMTVGHAILIARLKPEDQKRVIAPGMRNGYGAQQEGLWQYHGGSLEFATEAEERAHEKATKDDPYRDLKTVSVRELEAWIRDHIRFDVEHAAKAQPLTFESTLTRVSDAAAQPGRGKKVISITHEYRVADDARDESERTYGSQSWKLADGTGKSKTCEHAVLGVVVAGRGQGETFQVCVARDKCRVHFADVVQAKEKAAKLREQGKGKQAARVEKKQEESSTARWERERREREALEKAWRELSAHLLPEIATQAKAAKALTAAQAKYLTTQEFSFDRADLEKHLGASWFKTPAAAIVLMAAMPTYSDGFDEYVKRVAKPLGLNVKRLEAIRDKHQPKPAAAAPAKAKK